MRFYMNLHAVFVITLLFFTAFSLTLTDPKVREILRSDGLPQLDHADQQPLEAITRPLPASNPESTHVSIVVAELQAASDAVSPERPIAKMTAVVLATGVLFGLGMGL